MNLQEGLKMLRMEKGLTQTELALALNVSFTAVSRWENGRARPNKAASVSIVNFAKEHQASALCLEYLNRSLFSSRADIKEVQEKAKEITEQMKIEKREMLTSEQLKMVLDSINIGIIAVRAYTDKAEDMEVFYCNEHLAQTFGLTREEMLRRYRHNPWFLVHPEDVEKCRNKTELMVKRQIPEKEVSDEFRVIMPDHNVRWISMSYISRHEYSFGKELFITCQDITDRVEAQRQYKTLLGYRNAFFGDSLAFMHCSVTSDTIIQVTGTDPEMCRIMQFQKMDDIFEMYAQMISDEESRKRFKSVFNRKDMLEAFSRGEVKKSEVYYNSTLGHRVETSYALFQNPLNREIEAFVYSLDAQIR